ncbi:MAG: response regulator transcription factor [Bacteroides sp.]|nr:response regulator transcription factor [Bacteroides sp.]
MEAAIKCVAIDDEPLALDIIDNFCQRLGNVALKKFTDPKEGLEYILNDQPDIVFLDIEMDAMDGITIASQLPADCCFIFTTAYLKYALNGFDLDAVDYLHKPFAFGRFQVAFAKALRRIGRQPIQTSSQCIVLKQDYNNISIPLDDIMYIEAVEGYSKIFRSSGECVMSRILLKNILAMLPANDFLRIHRSFIVSRSKVQSFKKQELMLSNGKTLPVGRLYAPDLINTFNA